MITTSTSAQMARRATYAASSTERGAGRLGDGRASMASIAMVVRRSIVASISAERAGVDEHRLELDHVVVREVRSPTRPSSLGLCRVGGRHGDAEQRGRLAVAQVVTDRLAHGRRFAERPEHVVSQLERLPERIAVGRQHGSRSSSSRPARAAPTCSGRSIVYLPDL